MRECMEGSLLGQSRLLWPKPAQSGQACLGAAAVQSLALCPGWPQRWQDSDSMKPSSKYLLGADMSQLYHAIMQQLHVACCSIALHLARAAAATACSSTSLAQSRQANRSTQHLHSLKLSQSWCCVSCQQYAARAGNTRATPDLS